MKKTRYTSDQFSRYLDIVISRWEDALALQKEWPSIDPEERAEYTVDWPVNNEFLFYLEEYQRTHELTHGQKVQWEYLQKLILEHTQDLLDMGYDVLIPKRKGNRAVA